MRLLPIMKIQYFLEIVQDSIVFEGKIRKYFKFLTKSTEVMKYFNPYEIANVTLI